MAANKFDRLAKGILRQIERTELWGKAGSGYWLRAQPKTKAVGPRLKLPGTRLFKTQPDGMWISVYCGEEGEPSHCDVVAVEACKSPQNLNDKRSRYFPSSHSLMVEIRRTWLVECIVTPGRGNVRRPRWMAFNRACLAQPDKKRKEFNLPVRYLRVIYLLKAENFGKLKNNHVPTGYEFFAALSTFKTWRTNTTLREKLKRVAIGNHFLP